MFIEYGKTNSSINIIVVDWTSLAVAPLLEYPTVARSTRYAGLDIAELLLKLRNKGHLKLDNVHLIGYSLGAHAAGVAGYEVQRQTNTAKVGRITGLDPAGYGFTVTVSVTNCQSFSVVTELITEMVTDLQLRFRLLKG